jgi:hypothetical protein
MTTDKKLRLALLALSVGLPLAGMILTGLGVQPLDIIGGGVH